MKSLRDLLHALLNWTQALYAAWIGEHMPRARPAHGPAHPHRYVRAPRAGASGTLGVLVPRLARPRHVPPPPHILALLANAPDVEPEFARLRRRAITLLAPVRALHARVRVYNPRPAPAPLAAPARPTGASWALRMTRATSAFSEWLALTTPAPRGKRH